jgi:hypothetical protein
MGEIADMMLDGTMCSCCGEFLDTDNGYPTLCDSCAAADAKDSPQTIKKKPCRQKIKCPLCEKNISKVGLGDHVQDVHYDRKEAA